MWRYLRNTGLCLELMSCAFMQCGRMADGVFCFVAMCAAFGCAAGVYVATQTAVA